MPQVFRTVFISTCFCAVCRVRTQEIADFLNLYQIPYDFGEIFGGQHEITAGVRSRLEACSIVIVILTRKKQICEGSWAPSQWVIDEAVCADSQDKHLIILAEEGVIVDGLLKNKERLIFEPQDGFNSKFLLRVMRQMITALGSYGLTIGLKPVGEAVKETGEVITHISDEPVEDDCGNNAKDLIEKVKELTAQGQYGEALKFARQCTEIAPDCWRGFTSKAGLLAKEGFIEEAEEVLSDVLRKFHHNNKACACALHNKAGILEATSGRNPLRKLLLSLRHMLEESLRLDPERIYTRASLAIVLTQLDELSQAERLIEDSLTYRGFPEAFLFELESRGIVVEVLSKLPRWIERILSSFRRGNSDEHSN
jgi:hypothetical protein